MAALLKKIIHFIKHAPPLPGSAKYFWPYIKEDKWDPNGSTSKKLFQFITNVKMPKTAGKTLWELDKVDVYCAN